MILDLQKANVLKRLSACIFDMIILFIIIAGVAFSLSAALDYDAKSDALDSIYKKYETEYGVSFDMSAEEYEKMTEAEKKNYENAAQAVVDDDEAQYLYSLLINITLIITTFSILTAYLIVDFLVPLLFKNGQTLGKRIFGIAVMRIDGVKISAPILFIRTVLCKFTIETMIPVILVIMLIFGTLDITGAVVILLILGFQVVLICATKTNSAIHDTISGTVVVDMASQMIFDTPEALNEYKKKIHAESVAKAQY